MFYFILSVIGIVLLLNFIANTWFLSLYKNAEKEADRLIEEDKKYYKKKRDEMNK